MEQCQKANWPTTTFARDDGDLSIELDIYQITVPYGSISGDDRFWKHIDEDHIDRRGSLSVYCENNGIRYGEGFRTGEWKYFESIMEREGATFQKSTMSRVKKGSLDFPLRGTALSRKQSSSSTRWTKSWKHPASLTTSVTIFFRCPSSRRPDGPAIRELPVCPVVRNLIKEIRPSPLNEPRSYEWFNREHLYDLRLREDVPQDHFLVIAPASLANLPNNLGHTFLIRTGEAHAEWKPCCYWFPARFASPSKKRFTRRDQSSM